MGGGDCAYACACFVGSVHVCALWVCACMWWLNLCLGCVCACIIACMVLNIFRYVDISNDISKI